MRCEDALLLISAHMDGMNSQEEENALRAHLCECEQCRDILGAYEEADADIASLQERAPEDLCGNVMAQIKKAKQKKKFRPWAATAVAAVLFLAVGVGAVMEEYDVIDLVEDEAIVDTEAVPQMASMAESQPMARSLPAADAQVLAQQLADENNAEVVLIHELYYEVESYECTDLEEGYVLYILPDHEAAVLLSDTYGCVIYRPSDTSEHTQYYALLAAQ